MYYLQEAANLADTSGLPGLESDLFAVRLEVLRLSSDVVKEKYSHRRGSPGTALRAIS